MTATITVHSNTPTFITTDEASLDLFVVINGMVVPEDDPDASVVPPLEVGIPPD